MTRKAGSLPSDADPKRGAAIARFDERDRVNFPGDFPPPTVDQSMTPAPELLLATDETESAETDE